MKAQELKTHLSILLTEAATSEKIAKTAAKNNQSLCGNGFYAHRFHAAIVSLSVTEKKIRPQLDGLQLPPSSLGEFDECLVKLKDPGTKSKDRVSAIRTLHMVCETVINPKAEALTASPIPYTESVLPMDVVRGTRGYFVKMVTQANGNYEHGWYDACSVMIRKFVENLIIEVYEKHSKEAGIKDSSGEFLMLGPMIAKLLADTSWNLSRNTKRGLTPIKELGDRAAHARRFIAEKPDVDKVIPGLRDIADELLQLAGLR
jgi:hypothetical protein